MTDDKPEKPTNAAILMRARELMPETDRVRFDFVDALTRDPGYKILVEEARGLLLATGGMMAMTSPTNAKRLAELKERAFGYVFFERFADDCKQAYISHFMDMARQELGGAEEPKKRVELRQRDIQKIEERGL